MIFRRFYTAKCLIRGFRKPSATVHSGSPQRPQLFPGLLPLLLLVVRITRLTSLCQINSIFAFKIRLFSHFFLLCFGYYFYYFLFYFPFFIRIFFFLPSTFTKCAQKICSVQPLRCMTYDVIIYKIPLYFVYFSQKASLYLEKSDKICRNKGKVHRT